MNEEITFQNPYWLLDKVPDKQTEFVIILASACLPKDAIELTQVLLKKINVVIKSSNTLPNNKAIEIFITTPTHLAWVLFRKLLDLAVNEEIDIAVLPVSARKKKLLVCDMDSTIVQTETLDDIAEKLGLCKQVSEITARAMRGELDFRQALQQRVSLLKGRLVSIVDEVAESIQFNPGAETLLRVAQEHGIRTVLVSGGFELIVKRVAEKLGFDCYVCNQLSVSDARLNGSVLEPVVDGNTKLKALLEECRKLDINPVEACAIGDGANDLPMLKAAGLGIGFQAKPLVRATIPYQINYSGLDSAIAIMGIDSLNS